MGGMCASTLTAWGLGYDREPIRRGLYGFNGMLVGIAVICIMPFSYISVLFLLVGAALSTVVTHLFTRQQLLPTLTAPFRVDYVIDNFCEVSSFGRWRSAMRIS